MDKDERTEQRQHIKDMVLAEWEKKHVVFASIDGLHKCSLDEFVKQPLEGILYDINRDESTVTAFLNDPKWINDYALTKLLRYYYEKSKEPCKKPSLWHDGNEKPQTGRIFYESEEEDGFTSTGTADYDLENDRFYSDIETYYSGPWGRCHIKRWIYEQDILSLK